MAEKILIIDDDVDTLRLVGLMLQRQGYEISAAANGTQGLAKALEERPDLILLDVMMPDMDGYEVARNIRAQSEKPVLIAMTGYGQPEDRRKSKEAGFDYHLTKPVDPARLQDLLAKIGER
jgi:CheY-like chemotaxis protein